MFLLSPALRWGVSSPCGREVNSVGPACGRPSRARACASLGRGHVRRRTYGAPALACRRSSTRSHPRRLSASACGCTKIKQRRPGLRPPLPCPRLRCAGARTRVAAHLRCARARLSATGHVQPLASPVGERVRVHEDQIASARPAAALSCLRPRCTGQRARMVAPRRYTPRSPRGKPRRAPARIVHRRARAVPGGVCLRGSNTDIRG